MREAVLLIIISGKTQKNFRLLPSFRSVFGTEKAENDLMRLPFYSDGKRGRDAIARAIGGTGFEAVDARQVKRGR